MVVYSLGAQLISIRNEQTAWNRCEESNKRFKSDADAVQCLRTRVCCVRKNRMENNTMPRHIITFIFVNCVVAVFLCSTCTCTHIDTFTKPNTKLFQRPIYHTLRLNSVKIFAFFMVFFPSSQFFSLLLLLLMTNESPAWHEIIVLLPHTNCQNAVHRQACEL